MNGVTMNELTEHTPRCAACGEPLPVAYGHVLWEYWGLGVYPGPVKLAAKQAVTKLEGKWLCWSCFVKTLVLFSAFLQANGELDEVGLALAGEDNGDEKVG